MPPPRTYPGQDPTPPPQTLGRLHLRAGGNQTQAPRMLYANIPRGSPHPLSAPPAPFPGLQAPQEEKEQDWLAGAGPPPHPPGPAAFPTSLDLLPG